MFLLVNNRGSLRYPAASSPKEDGIIFVLNHDLRLCKRRRRRKRRRWCIFLHHPLLLLFLSLPFGAQGIHERLISLQFLNLGQSIGLLGWGISLLQGRYLTQTDIHTLRGI
jgi:hypothetical protein